MKRADKTVLLSEGLRRKYAGHNLLDIAAGKKGAKIFLSSKDKKSTLALNPEQQGILLLCSTELKVEKGEVNFSTLNFNQLAKLQVFIDHAMNSKPVDPAGKLFWSFQPVSFNSALSGRDMEYWLIEKNLRKTPEVENFCTLLRKSECYNLVDFLLRATSDNGGYQLQDLCLRYGLSTSHFRRLCRRALGNQAKTELKEWRLVRALFDMIEGKDNLTTIALNQGYSSLSHLSNEVKEIVGVTPRKIKSIINKGR